MSDPAVVKLASLASGVTDDPDVCAAHGQDWSRRFSGQVRAVVRPVSVEEVSAVVSWCAAEGIPLIPQGGNTSLVGGSVPAAGDEPVVVVSLVRMDGLGDVDIESRAVTARAGVTIAQLDAHARRSGMRYGVDLASRDSATVGGTVATNAGGVRVCAYGMTRDQVLGMEFVRGDGTVISRMAGLPKDNTGYNLAQLLTGSEGTLGIITAARLALQPPPPPTTVALVGVRSVAESLALLHDQPMDATIFGAEIVDAAGLRLVAGLMGAPVPLSREWPYALLLEATDIDLPDDADAAVAMDSGDARRLWEYRERQSEAVSTLGVVHKLDISAPRSHLDELSRRIIAAVPAPGHAVLFGHVADGNIHVEIAGLAPGDDAIDRRIFDIATELGGVVSAEHGVGRAKAAWLGLSRSEAELDTMAGIKKVFDPRGILNPGALLERRRLL